MQVRIRKFDQKAQEDAVFIISKTDLIQNLQEQISKKLNVQIEHQKLIYKGKQLAADNRIIDYGIKFNDVIQLLIRSNEIESKKQSEENSHVEEEESKKEENQSFPAKSRYYKTGDPIDVIDPYHGAWFEAKIIDIFTKEPIENPEENDLIFKIRMDRNVETAPFEVKFDDIRPRAIHKLKNIDLNPGMVVFVNYNIEKPGQLGYWYDFKIVRITNKQIKGTLFVGKDHVLLENCNIKFVDDIMKIEETKLLHERIEPPEDIPLRKLPLYCNRCKDVPTKKCKECGCKVCGEKESAGQLFLCDECDGAYHLTCLDPPFSDISSDEWYCPECKVDDSEIVKPGEKLKISKKKMKMPSNQEGGTSKDWGKGMACAGRVTECTIVPKNHYGPIPGIDVGTCWQFRIQVSEAGVHRPLVAGIHGSEKNGAYSLVLSGGYEDDTDNGDEFYYTGSGGRDFSGNKRVNKQSKDQTLTRMNKALALNCNTKFNDKTGGEATNWKGGKPVRVVRNYKLGKHSKKYAPKDGNRYDGIYKVVKYFPEKGKSGYIVWRFLLRRDDPEPAPWHKNGKKFDMIHLDSVKKDKTKKKRKLSEPSDDFSLEQKRMKIEPYKLDLNIEELISADQANEKLWTECKDVLKEGKQKFFIKLQEVFECVCCMEVLFEPVTVPCKHNVCKKCLKRSFNAECFTCPLCRFDLGKKFVMNVNDNLFKVLKALFPGYENGR